jgi:hypothetical protein
MTPDIKIVVDAVDKATDELNDIKKSLTGIDGATKKTNKSTKNLNSSMANLKKLAAGTGVLVAARAVVAFGKASIATASNVEEMSSKFDVVFGQSSVRAKEALADFGDEVNRSRFELMEMAASVQDTFVPMGFARDEAADLSITLTKLATDVASFNNAQDADVMRDFQSALVGNTETVRKYGIVITQTVLDAELLRMGIEGGNKAATEAQKVQARLNLIMEGTSDAHGDAAKTADSYANSMKGLDAASEELRAAIGEGLLPVMSELISVSTKAIRNQTEVITMFKEARTAAAGSAEATDEYERIMAQVAVRSITYAEAQEMLNGIIDTGTTLTAQSIIQNEINAAMMEESTKGAEDLAVAQKEVNQQMDELKLFMEGPLKKENESYQDDLDKMNEKADELKTQIGELERVQWRTPEQEEELTGLYGDLEDINSQIVESGEKHDEATKRILFNITKQRLAMDGLSQTEADVLGQMAKDWDLIDEATFDAFNTIGLYADALTEGKINADDLRDAINGIPNEKIVRISVGTTGQANFDIRNMPRRAVGGPVNSNTPTIVGERGPEIFVPPSSGQIVPNDRAFGGGPSGGGDVVIHFSPGMFLGNAQDFYSKFAPLAVRAVREAQQRGGLAA